MVDPRLPVLAAVLLVGACGSEPAEPVATPTATKTATTPSARSSPEHDRCLAVLAAAAKCRDYHGFVEDCLPSEAEGAAAVGAAKDRLARWAELAERERECRGGVDGWLDRGGSAGSDGDDDAREARERLERAARDGDCERIASGFQHAGGFPPPAGAGAR
jgi:hypothetical protein